MINPRIWKAHYRFLPTFFGHFWANKKRSASQDSTITVKTGDKEISIQIGKARNCEDLRRNGENAAFLRNFHGIFMEFSWNFHGILGSKSGQSMSKQLVNVAYSDKRATYFSLSITSIIQLDVQNTDSPTQTAQGDQPFFFVSAKRFSLQFVP